MQIVKSSQASAVLGFLVVGFALPLYLLLLSGFPTVDALKVCAMIFVQIVSGALIWAQVMHPRKVDIVEGVGMGLAIGSIFTVIGHQLFLPTSLKDFGWLLPVVVAAITSVTWRATKDSHKNFVLENVSGLFFVAFAVVLILKQWWWLLPLALPTGMAVYLLSDHGRDKLNEILKPCWLIVAASIVTVTVLMAYLRQMNFDWWIRSWDVVYHESKSISIAKFGPNENISLVGYPMNYHWFGNAWIGTNATITNLASWLSIAQVAPVFSAISISCTILTICRRETENFTYSNAFIILAILIFGTGGISPSNPPNVVSSIWSFAALIVAIDYIQSRNFYSFIALSLLGFATFSGKVSAGFIVITSFILIDLFNSLDNRKRLARAIMRSAALFILSLVSYLYVIGGPNRLGNNSFKVSYKGLGLAFGVEIERHPLIFALGTLGTLIQIAMISIPVLISLALRISNRIVMTFTAAIIFSGITPFSLLVDDGMTYFQANAMNLCAIGSGIALSSLWRTTVAIKQVTTKFLVTLCVTTAAFGFVRQFMLDFNWRDNLTTPGGPTPILVGLQMGFLIIYWAISVFITKSEYSKNQPFCSNTRLKCFAMITVFATTLPLILETPIGFYENMRTNSLNSFSVSFARIADASEWVRTKTSEDSIFATNKFCLETGSNACIDPKFFGVSSTTQRKMLVEGPYYVVGGPYFSKTPGVTDETKYPEWVQERLNLSRGFADKPTAEIAARLRELGVDWFYLFLDNTENRNWAPFATVEYQNTEVAILKLTDLGL